MSGLTNVTAVIKTFERPLQLSAALRSLQHRHPSLPVVIVDDSARSLPQVPSGEHITYIRTEFDIGASAGRNLGVENVATDFVLLMDDDMVVRHDTRLEKLLDVARQSGDLVSARQLDFGGRERIYHGAFELDGTVLTQRDADPDIQAPIAEAHYTHNFFIAPTELLRSVRWDDELKMGEHWDFFWRLHRAGHRSFVCTDVFYNHFPIRHRSYYTYRRRSAHYETIAMAKFGFTEFRRIKQAEKPISRIRHVAAKVWYRARGQVGRQAA